MNTRTEELKELRFGMFVCWSFSTFSGYEWTPGVDDISFFNPTGFDPDQWCKVMKDAGMGYILFLTKHHDGFCLCDTKTTDRKVAKSPLGIDVLAEVKKSCDKYGIKLALYFSEGDWDRVRKFQLQIKQDDQWKTIADGTNIGESLELKFAPEKARHVRLNITQTDGVPTILELELFKANK